MDIRDIIKIGVKNNASDIHIAVGIPPVYRIDGYLARIIETKVDKSTLENYARQLIGDNFSNLLLSEKDIDFAYSEKGLCRCRINVFLDRGNISMAIRIIPLKIPDYISLGLPPIIEDITKYKNGLVLITGSAGSGKSTTLAAIIDLINKKKSSHIITIEDPIEYIHEHKNSIINQREIGKDAKDFLSAIRGAVRQDPDVIAIGEMRDLETISASINASETGHLVISTMHTDSISSTIDRIIDSFPAIIQSQIRTRLASCLRLIINQKLLPKIEGGRVVATEVMVNTNAIRNIIRENRIHQINSVLQTSKRHKMQTMDQSLVALYNANFINEDILINDSVDEEYIKKLTIKRG